MTNDENRMPSAWVLLAGVLLAAGMARAQAGGPATQPAGRPAGSDLIFRLVTIGHGEAIYERFGHNALWMHDPSLKDSNIAFNYGVFDMGESGFILRFLRGRMWYWVDAWNVGPMLDLYREQRRAIWTDDLNLTPQQKLEMRRFLIWNVQKENKRYLYDYYKDNCSTRVRDAIDGALGGQIKQQLESTPAGRTYRWHTQVATANDPMMYTALLLVLGHPVDRPISAWQECFLPVQLRQHLLNMTVLDEQGQRVPLLTSDSQVAESGLTPLPDGPPEWLGAYLAIGVCWGGLAAWLGWLLGRPAGPLPDNERKRQAMLRRLRRRRRWVKIGIGLVAGVWLLLVSFCGWFMVWAWGFTSHVATYYNENVLHFSPLALPLLVLWVMLLLEKRWARRWSLWLALAVAGNSALGLILKILPWFYQVNGQLIALALPMHLGIAWAVYELARRPMEAEGPEKAGRT
jgi:hypothetical protein